VDDRLVRHAAGEEQRVSQPATDWTCALAVVAPPDDYDTAVASLAAHRSYLEALGTDARAVLDTITGGRPEVTFELFGE